MSRQDAPKSVDRSLAGPVCILVSWREQGRWRLLRTLRETGLEVRILQPLCLGPRWPRRLRRLSVRLSRLYLPLFALIRCFRAGVWVTWNTPTGVALGVLKRFFGRSLPPHVVRDFHVDPAWEQGAGLKLRLIRLAAPGMDFVLTTSRQEERRYAERFGFPEHCIRFLPESPPAELLHAPAQEPGEHVFAFGNSDRDFDTLVAAARGLERPVLILSQQYELPADAPGNVRLLRDFVSQEELCRLIGSAACCVLPLRDFDVAAGQNVMLEIMTLRRPLVVSDNVATREYAEHGVSAMFFRIGDHDDLLRQLRAVLDSPDRGEAMAARARSDVEKLAQLEFDVFLDVLARVPSCS